MSAIRLANVSDSRGKQLINIARQYGLIAGYVDYNTIRLSAFNRSHLLLVLKVWIAQ